MKDEDRKAYSPERIDEAAAQVARLADRAGVRVGLCGGLALQAFGSQRLTKNVDFIAQLPIDGLPIVRKLTFGGMETVAPNGVPVNVIVRDDDYRGLYESALASATKRSGTPCPIASAEYLAAMKLAARRQRDLVDLHWLIVAGGLDLHLTRKIIGQFVGGRFAVDAFDREVDVAKLDAARESRVRR